MSNLLPVAMKARVRREYRLRIFAVGAFVFASTLGALTLLFFPSFILVSSKLSLAEETLAAKDTSTSESYTQTVALIQQANNVASRLSAQNVDVSVSKALQEILAEAGDRVTVQGIVLSRTADAQYMVDMRGIASTRDELARFVERLERNAIVSTASVPFTSLAQAVDAEFTAAITIRTSQTP